MAKTGRSGRWLLALGLVAATVLAIWAAWPAQHQPPSQEPELPHPLVAEASADETGPSARKIEDSEDDTPGRPEAPPVTAVTDQPLAGNEAEACYQRGLGFYDANELIKARSELCKAYFSGQLSADQQQHARQKLTELAELTLIGRGSDVYPDDPYTGRYKCVAGDVLTKVERSQKLHVPWQLLIKVNNMRRPEDLEAGRRYKVVHGPFHAIVYKSAFLMDVYLHREGLEKVFIKRFRIGTGANSATPAGMWRAKLGGKHERPTWYPPPNSVFRGPIPYGHPDYAFGQKGLWIGLEGLEPATKPLTDSGIHSTNDPKSIGSAESLGCIRLADEDIELVYSLLYEHWSTVEVRP